MRRAVVYPIILTMKANLENSAGETAALDGAVAEADEFASQGTPGELRSLDDDRVVFAGMSRLNGAQGVCRDLREAAAFRPVLKLVAHSPCVLCVAIDGRRSS
jgi:hypothetical protein